MYFYRDGKLSKEGSLAIKGFAILFLVCHHALLRNEDPVTFLIPSSFMPRLALVFRSCIPLFVFVTGYGVMCAKNNDMTWVIHRLKSIWTHYVPWVLFVYGVLFCIGKLSLDTFSRKDFLLDLTGAQFIFSNHQGILTAWWYIGAAYALVIIAPFVRTLVEKYGAVTLLLALVFPRIMHIDYEGLSLVLPWLFSMILGMLLAKEKREIHVNHPVMTGTGCFLVFLVSTWLFIRWAYNFNYLRMSLPVPFLLLAIGCLCRSRVLFRILMYLGRYSFPIYIIHNLFLDNMKFLYQWYWLAAPLAALVLSLLIVVIGTKGYEILKRFYQDSLQ